MFEKLEIQKMADAMARHAATRQTAVSRNVANADTPGYKALDVENFADTYRNRPGFVPNATRPGHFGAGTSVEPVTPKTMQDFGAQSPNGNTVSLEGEMMKAVQLRQQHDMALAISRNTASILRTSLGRR